MSYNWFIPVKKLGSNLVSEVRRLLYNGPELSNLTITNWRPRMPLSVTKDYPTPVAQQELAFAFAEISR